MEDDSSPDKSSDEDLAIESEDDKPSSQSHPIKSRFESLEDISFDYIAYDQDITILGAKASGKSYLANMIMKGLHGINVWVYDFNSQFHSSKAIVFHDLNHTTNLLVIL